jgi:hypothetical protein
MAAVSQSPTLMCGDAPVIEMEHLTEDVRPSNDTKVIFIGTTRPLDFLI